jgi:hypothetical protein
MNAVTLQMLLHAYYTSPLESASPAMWAGLQYLLTNYLIRSAGPDGCYDVTERGRVHVKALLDAPLPREQWVAAWKSV